jgi:uncharacterized protein YoxC
MRARRREINIFNMSLLDILCGALGAFCFMMIVALPYYIPPGKARDLRKSQEETDKLMRDLEKMKERLPDQKSIKEMEEMLQRLEAQVKALQGQVNILTAEKEELQGRVNQLAAEKKQLQGQVSQLTADKQSLQGQVSQLTAEKQQLQLEEQRLADRNQQLTTSNNELIAANKELTGRLAQRQPFVVLARASETGQNIDVLLTDKMGDQEGPNPMFDAWVGGKFDILNELRTALFFGRGMALGMMIEAPVERQFKAYLRLANEANRRENTAIDSALFQAAVGVGTPTRLPEVILTKERFWTLVGTITIDQNYRPIFKEATTEERDAEWKTLTNSTPPPTPTPTPPPSAAERAAAEAARAKFEAERVKKQEVHKKFSQLMRIPFDDSGKNDAEILRLTEELLKEMPPREGLRREVQFRRDRVLEMKARREGRPQPSPSPNENVSPLPPQPGPAPSPP